MSQTFAGVCWGQGNFDHYHLQDYEETMSGVQRGRMSFSARGVHDSFHRPFPYHAPQDYYQPTPQHHHQSPQHHHQPLYHHHHPPPPMGYDEPVSTRTSTTVSRPSRQDRRRYATPFTNQLNGSSRRPTDLMRYSSMSDNNMRTLSTCLVGWVSSTHHCHHRSDLAWGRTPTY
jgi:hypothetical protein